MIDLTKPCVLVMNDMRSPGVDIPTTVALGTRESLISFYQRERVPLYQEAQNPEDPTSRSTWAKHFRKGGPLEGYNPIRDETHFSFQRGMGIQEERQRHG